MKIFHTILFLLSASFCFAQHLPVSPFLYENYTDIDNYFGETDSLLFKHKIKKVRIFTRTDTLHLIRVETYKDGKKLSIEEYDPSGKPDRTIRYSYKPGVVSAILIHYPSPDNFNLFPSRRFAYLSRSENNETIYTFRVDSTTGMVKMQIRHTWQKDGTILFEGFDTDNKMVATQVMKPIMSPEEYQALSKEVKTGVIANETEAYTYNDQGKLIHYKSSETSREDHYYYDDRGLLTGIDRFLRGKPDKAIIYAYEK